jgi:sigma-54 dependent transcriptional regulator, acetoin dehydrogenase operon transcriptional activator AcoR
MSVMQPARPEIASAWRRAALCGLDPGSVPSESDLAPVHHDSPLMVAAAPVLDGMVARLEDSRFTLLLADRDARIVDRRFGQRHLSRALDDALAVPGNRYSEETSGTNALATALEIGRGLTVHGEEHFFERLKVLTCYAGPIVHPVTGRVEGVLDITGYAQDVTPMMEPFVAFAVAAIEERLGQGHSRSQMRMLAAFQERTARTRRPVLVFGDGLTLANDAATAMLDGPAQLVLRELARGASGMGAGRAALPSGAVVEFVCDAVDGVRNASVVEIVTAPAERPVVPRRRIPAPSTDPHAEQLARLRANPAPVAVSGEPGTGRSTLVARLAAPIDGDAAHGRPTSLDGAGLTVADLDALAAATPAGLVVVDHVELLPDVVAHRLGALLDTADIWFALVSAPHSELSSEQLALVGRCGTHLDLAPLRARRAEIPAIANQILAGLRPGLHLAGSAVKALMAWTWPGNLLELRAVLEAAASATSGRVIAADALPLDRRRSARRPLSPLEQAEFDAITATLRRCAGNKTHAAAELGIGRTTLYRRMRELDIS